MILTPSGLRFRGQIFPCTIGKGGISAQKREGDGATPMGTHAIVGMYYRPDRLRAPQPWAQPIGYTDLWSDDSSDVEYNHHVRAPYTYSHENLHRADPLYDLVLVTDWNWPRSVPGKGSAIFVHQYRRKGFPTEGCVALRRDHLYWIASRITLGTRMIVPETLAGRM